MSRVVCATACEVTTTLNVTTKKKRTRGRTRVQDTPHTAAERMQTPSVWWPRCGLRVATLLSKKNVIFFFFFATTSTTSQLPSYDQRRMHPRDYREKSGFFPSLLLYNNYHIIIIIFIS